MPSFRQLLPTLVAGAALLAPAASADAAVTARTALLNGTSFSEFDQTNASTGTLTLDKTHAYEGGQAAKGTFNGGSNGYERGIYNVSWPEGSDVWYGAAFYLPTGFKSQMQGQVDIMRWDNFGALGTNDDRSGVVIHRNGMGNLMRMKFGVENVDIGPAFDIPEGRWFWLEVHQKLNRYDGQAYSEVFIDGKSVSTTTQANMYGTAVDRIRYGIVAIDQVRQTTPLTLWFDRATVSTSQVGPLGSSTTTTPTPTTTTTSTTTTPTTTTTTSTTPTTTTTSTTTTPTTTTTTSTTPTTTTLVEKAHGQTATASSSQKSTYAPKYGNDADITGTRWSSAFKDGQWWQVDLGRTRSVEQVKVKWEAAYAKQYAIDVSTDGKTWTTAANATASGAGTVTTSFSARSARYVRVRGIQRGTSYGISFWDVQVLGVSD